MATYGMKDASNMILRSLKTGDIALYVDYANASNNEWTSERTYATKKGTNAIAWDGAREGTLTVESELFDWNYLALVIGAEIAEGENSVMQRKVVEVKNNREAQLEGQVNADSITVVKLKSDGLEHDGMPLKSTTGSRSLLPKTPSNVTANANDTSVVLTFSAVDGADEYVIERDSETIATITENSYTDNGLTASSQHNYTVTAKNAYGTSAKSAQVEVTMAESGTSDRTAYKEDESQAQQQAQAAGTLSTTGQATPAYEVTGTTVKFNENTKIGDKYAIYYEERAKDVRTISIDADKFPDSFEIYADALVREQETGKDEFVQIHYKNARPQSNFTLTQSATEPTSLSVTFDLFPGTDGNLAEYKLVK